MREILFRAKTSSEICGFNTLKDGTWVHGFYRDKVGLPVISQFEIDRGGDYIDYEIDEKTLCQFTGLVDKNGKKIFEGDIVEVWVERNIQGRKQSNQDTLVKARAVVDYGETFCNIAYYLNYDNDYNKKITQPKNKEYYDRDIQQRPIHCFTQQRIKENLEQNNQWWKGTNERLKKMAEIEVIGNVWDNKELLEG